MATLLATRKTFNYMKYTILLTFILLSGIVISQTEVRQDSIYDFFALDKEPIFDCGRSQLKDYIQKNVRFPKKSKKNNSSGKVFAQFIIEASGEVTNVKIIKGVDEYIDAETIRLLRKMPKWTPGQKNNLNVRTKFFLPINFKLQDK